MTQLVGRGIQIVFMPVFHEFQKLGESGDMRNSKRMTISKADSTPGALKTD